MYVQFEVFGEVVINRELLRWRKSITLIPALMHSLFHDLEEIEKVQFLTEGSHGSGGWEDLADSTVKEKMRKGLLPWKERATNALFESLTSSARGSVRETITGMGGKFGSTIPYGMFQQTGTVRMPQRKVMDLTTSDRVLLVKKVQIFLTKGEIVPITML